MYLYIHALQVDLDETAMGLGLKDEEELLAYVSDDEVEEVMKRSGVGLLEVCTHRNSLQHTATRCNMLQHPATHCNRLQHSLYLMMRLRKLWENALVWGCLRCVCTATHCNALQHTAIGCNMLQHAATLCNTCVSLMMRLRRQ